MEEQRQRQEEEARLTTVASAADAGVSSTVTDGEFSIMRLNTQLLGFVIFVICAALFVSESPGTLLKMSAPHLDSSKPALPDFSRMTEDEQIAYALQMSMQGAGEGPI